MFTHQTPEPRYLLDPQGVSPHLRGQTIPRQQPLQTQEPAPHTPSPNSSAQPLRQQPRSRGGGTETVSRNAEAMARLLRVSMPPLFAASELRYRLRLSPLRPLSVTASRSGKMAADGGGGGGGGGRGGGKCTGPARPAPQGQRGRGRSCPPPFYLWAAARRCLSTEARRQPTGGRAVDRNLRLFHNRCIQQFTEDYPTLFQVTLHHSACRAKRNLKTQLKGTLNNISIGM
ncbi:DEAD-box ATP-dependent RNA helicase 30-like isoform X3 [Cervus canadensis]|uniref:DEAD-box ATP-dependent RNA helicase 30-like isoform X3 n=1 Tax=Cervus canadensis TaxID=1574408 RepID=UPI001C9E9876|nr:DEAD-box ATP-dependent RNA helicase 30-like isoform X3 [Cervus canadensis]